MFSTVGRAAARSVPLARGAALKPAFEASQTLVIRPAVASRGFITSSNFAAPSKSADATATKKKATAATKKAKETKAAPSKKTKPAKAAVPKPKKEKKEISPEQQEKIEVRREKLEIRELKKLALYKDGPVKLANSAWNIFILDKYNTGSVKDGGHDANDLGAITSTLAAEYKQLSEADLQRLESQADANRAANLDAERQWVVSHERAAIYVANVARRRLREKDVSKKLKTLRMIPDDRIPKRPVTSFFFYVKARVGKIDGLIPERSRVLGEEWKNMSESEKQPWVDLAENEKVHYQREALAVRAEARAYWLEHSPLPCNIRPQPEEA